MRYVASSPTSPGQLRRSKLTAPTTVAASSRARTAQLRERCMAGDYTGPPVTIPPMSSQPIPIRPPIETAPEPAEVEVSVIIPVRDEVETVEELATRVAAVLEGLGRTFEILFVDDGSRDATPERLRRSREPDGRVKPVRRRPTSAKAAALSARPDQSQRRTRV